MPHQEREAWVLEVETIERGESSAAKDAGDRQQVNDTGGKECRGDDVAQRLFVFLNWSEDASVYRDA
jgi:hypothetical protein